MFFFQPCNLYIVFHLIPVGYVGRIGPMALVPVIPASANKFCACAFFISFLHLEKPFTASSVINAPFSTYLTAHLTFASFFLLF
jgi:hypothetical protein